MTISRVLAVGFDTIHVGVHQWQWYQVGLKSMFYDHEQVEQWLLEHTSKRVRYHAALFLFEDPDDATLFSLRWL